MRGRPRPESRASTRTRKIVAVSVALGGLVAGGVLAFAPADLSFGRTLDGVAKKATVEAPRTAGRAAEAPAAKSVAVEARIADTPIAGDAAPSGGLVHEVARGTSPAEPYGDGAQVLFNNGYRFDPARELPQVPDNLTATPLEPGRTGSFLVQTSGPVLPGWTDQIESAGGRVFSYVPNYAFLVRAKGEAVARLQALPFVRWVGPYQPAFKLSAQPEMSAMSGPSTLTVLLFPDADLAAARADFEAMGATVLEATDSGRNKLLRVSLDMSFVPNLASREDVAWVEPWKQPTVENSQAQWVVQTNVTNNRHVWDMGIHGEGQVVHTSDSGIRTSHNMFRDDAVPITDFGDYPTHRKVIAYKLAIPNAGILFGDTGGASYHGTHTAGTLIGDDSPSAADLRDGMALKAKIYFTDAGANANSIITPGDLNLLFQPPYDGNAGGAARLSSNSWGSDAAGAYTVSSMTVDQFLWDHKDFLISFSNGNAGPQPATVGSPATNKDGIGMGACQNGSSSNLLASFSSRGATADGRIKPTLVAPGQNIQSALGSGDTGYQTLSGTSMASPSGTGAITLIRQYLTEGWYPTGVKTPANAFTPSGALLKAMAIASTDNDMTGSPIPNYNVGWGRIKDENILYFAGDSARVAVVDQRDGLLTGEYIDYQVRVVNRNVPLKISLCWYDKEGNPGAAREIVNDLDLRVTVPTGDTTYVGNAFAGGQSALVGARDSINVEENVRFNAPVFGLWTIRVRANNVPFGPQPFALAISGGLGVNAGLVQLDRTTYGRSDVIGIRVEDQDATSPISVAVSSNSESTPENLSLTGSNGVFQGTISTTPVLAANGDGMLSVSHGDAITVSYVDASTANTLSALATADFTGPLITNVAAGRQDASVIVTWSTDTPASSRVYFGGTPALGQSAALDPELVTTHQVQLNGLLPQQTYYFDVESSDRVHNLTRDDAGGAHYRFTTGKDGDILLVIGDPSFGQKSAYLTAMRNRGWDPSLLEGGIITNPVLGDRTHGLRSYSAVWWQVGQEQYPPVEDAARDSISAYLSGGGRFSIVAHDLGWAFTDPTSGFQTPARQAWIENDLHFRFLTDPATWPANTGQSGDPISGSYVAGVPYAPFRSGGAGDEIDVVPGTGTANIVWKDTNAPVGNIGMRWENGVPNGNPAQAVWGGTPTRIVNNNFEWVQITDLAAREDILDKTLIWLIGHDHPDVAITGPNGGESFASATTTISWTETAYGGQSIASRALYYSDDAGYSWSLITSSPGTSPYTWDISGLPNGTRYLVRVEASDTASPALRGSDASNATFTINRPGGDNQGPVVVAGSQTAQPNPIDNRNPATLQARVTDASTGGANVTAAEWSRGAAAAPAGSGTPMSGSFASPTVDVSATIPALTVPTGDQTFWVRGRDAAGNWGNARAQSFFVNGNEAVAVEGSGTLRFELEQSQPNPSRGLTATMIRFTVPVAVQAELAIYNVRGQKVRTLLAGQVEPGRRTVSWDGRTDGGRLAGSGVYFYRLTAGANRAQRKLVWMD